MPKPFVSSLLAGVLALTTVAATPAEDAPDVWLFSGQSNMQRIGGPVREAVGRVVAARGHEYEPVYVAAPGKPIEAWLDPEHRDHALWTRLVEAVAEAKENGGRFRGFVWYQGESNVKQEPHRYGEKLKTLIARVRQATGEPRLPVVVVQIGAATAYDGSERAVGVIREFQRRVAAADPHVALVTAIDAEIGDYTVHLSKAGAELVSARVAVAADRLAYGNADAHWGPRLRAVRFADEKRTHVVVEFDDVHGALKLAKGGLAGFAAEVGVDWTSALEQVDAESRKSVEPEVVLYPVAGAVLSPDRLLLRFERPLPTGTTLSHAAERNAQYGPWRRWGIEFGGLRDEAGHVPAFAFVPIEPAADGTPDGTAIPKLEPGPGTRADWEQIAVNCVGRFPEAVTEPTTEAGVESGGWRQPYWNPASAGLVPNLVDRDGRVSSVSFRTGVWYMSPYFRELRGGDDALMASWCKNSTHVLSGLQPGERYDLAVYLLQGPPRKKTDPSPERRRVRVNVLRLGTNGKVRDADVVASALVDVPADGRFEGFEVAAENGTGDCPGNVVLLSGVPASEAGRLTLTVQTTVRKGDKTKWEDTTLAGVQIRRVSD